MPEAITKYALNSTLGKENFMPLDEMIKAERTLVASDENMLNLRVLNNKFSISNLENEVLVGKFKLYFPGTINIYLSGTFNELAGDTSVKMQYKIIQKDVIIKEGEIGPEQLYSTVIQSVNVQDGRDIYIYFTPIGDWEASVRDNPIYTLNELYIGAGFRQSIGINV